MRRPIRFLLHMDARAWRRILLAFLVFGGAGLALLTVASALGLRDHAIVDRWLGIAAHSPFGLLIAIAVFSLLAFLGVPQVVLIAATVVAFGPWLGGAYSWIGTMVSASLGFWLGRAAGGRLLHDVGGLGLARFVAMISRNGLMASLVVRLIPSAPFIAVNMAAGMTAMRFAAFAAGTAIGILPKILLTAVAGRFLIHAGHGEQLGINLAVLAASVALWVGGGLLARRWSRSQEVATAEEGT